MLESSEMHDNEMDSKQASLPLLVIPALPPPGSSVSPLLLAKGLVSSLTRTIFTGEIVVLRHAGMPLFKVERKDVQEVTISSKGKGADLISLDYLDNVGEFLSRDPRQWLIVAHPAGLVLRNPDHLIPPDGDGPYAAPSVDFYWLDCGKHGAPLASPGLWAVRAGCLPALLARLASVVEEVGAEVVSIPQIWTRVVENLPLRKRKFEVGEAVAPARKSVDWSALSDAAFVTVPDWSEIEQRKFLQALYFGTYLGDESGLFLNLLEA